MGAIDTAARIRATALDAIGKQCFGEDIGFDMFPGLAPGNGQQPVLVYTLVFTRRSPLLGRGDLMHVTQLLNVPTDAQVTEAAGTALAQLRDLAAKLLAPAN